MSENTFASIQPTHPLIKEQVDYYYFQDIKESNFSQVYLYYPNYVNGLNVYLNTDLTWDEEERILQGNKEGQSHCTLTMTYEKSRKVQMYGQLQKLGIIFKPLGINHFITGNVDQLQIQTVGYFHQFGQAFIELTRELFDEDSIEKRALLLDNFLLQHHRSFDESRIKKAVDLIFEHHTDITAQDIANQLNINRKTLFRLFKKHIGYSFKNFKAVVKFRLALNQYQATHGKVKLSDLAFDNGYYDHPHFIHHIQAIAGLSPQELFDSLQKASKDGLYWTFQKKN